MFRNNLREFLEVAFNLNEGGKLFLGNTFVDFILFSYELMF